MHFNGSVIRLVLFTPALLLLVLLFPLVSCAGTPPAGAGEDGPGPGSIQEREELLAEQIKQLIRIASPETLREAISLIRKEGFDRTPRGVELFYVADRLMRSVYPFEPQQESLPTEPSGSIFPFLFSETAAGRYPAVEETEASYISLLVSTLSLLDSPHIFETGRSMPPGSERAADTARQLVSLNSRTVLAHYLLGRYYEGKKEIEEAEKYYRSASEAGEEWSSYPALLGLARISFAGGDYSESARYRENLLERYPGQLVLELQTIEAYLAAEMMEKSDNLLSDMIRTYPENAMVVCKRPLLLELYGRYDQASRLTEALERSYGETSDLLLVKARLLMQRNRVEDSLALLEKGSRLYGTEPFFNAMYERTLIESGNAERAKELLDQNRGGQTSIAAFEALLKSSMENGDWDRASLYLSSLLESGGRKPDFLRYGIQIAGNQGQGGTAIEFARELASHSSAGPREQIRLAGVLISFGNAADRREASALIDTLLTPDLPARERSILFYQRSLLVSDRQQQLELLRSALLEDLQNTDALTAIARLYREQGELKKAYRYFSQAAALLPDNPQIAEELREVELKLAGNEGSAGAGLRPGSR